MDILPFKIISAIAVAFAGFLAGVIPIRKKQQGVELSESFSVGVAFACGIFVGAALFHMVPDARRSFLRAFDGVMNYPIAILLAVVGFMSLWLIEVVASRFNEHKVAAGEPTKATHFIAYLVTVAISIHALVAGAALGVSVILGDLFILFVAIMAHKSAAAFSLGTTLMQDKLPDQKVLFMILVFSLMTPLGIAFGAVIIPFLSYHHGLFLDAIFRALAAGTFLYIGIMHNLSNGLIGRGQLGPTEVLAAITGGGVMALLAIWL